MKPSDDVQVQSKFRVYSDRSERLTPEFLKEEFVRIHALGSKAEEANTAADWLRAVKEWDDLNAYFLGQQSRATYEYSKNTQDPGAAEAYRYHQQEVTPAFENAESEFLGLLLRSRHAGAIDEKYGKYLLTRLKAGRSSVAPENVELRTEIRNLQTRYSKLLSIGETTVGGETMTISRAAGLQASSDPVLRRQAFESYRSWFLEQREELSDIYTQIVDRSHRMAGNLGAGNFIPLGYAAMGRTDYGPEQVAKLRGLVKTFFSPIQARIHREQARTFGTPTLKCWDAASVPMWDLPDDVAPVATQLSNASEVFERLAPPLHSHFERMREMGLIDLPNRPGKRPGAFCVQIPDEGTAAIFCNSTGQAMDVRTLIHEMGHAFQAWESQATLPLSAYYLPTLDGAEIHSMGMEYLALRHIGAFFNEKDAARFRKRRWRDAVEILTYACVVDEFQHWVYENPRSSPDERDTAWNAIHDAFRGEIDFSGCNHYKAARWYAQHHIFQTPFYYIDYAIAEIGAMQLALVDARDASEALRVYLNLCRVGGSMSVLSIFSEAGMRSPFDEHLIKDLAAHASDSLDLG